MALRLEVPPEAVTPDPPGATRNRRNKPGSWGLALTRDWRLYTLVALPLLYFAVFRYLPMAGNVIAFRQFQPGGSIFGEKWVGLKYVTLFINDPSFWQAFQNTIVLGVLTLLFCFPMPIIFALMLNELRSQKFKKFVQTVAYLPEAFSPGSQAVLRRLFPDAVHASAADAEVLGLNAVSDGRTVVLPAQATSLAAALRDRGYETVGVDLSELLKAGGGPKCCTLRLRQGKAAK